MHPGDVAVGFSDLEMTWLLYCAGAATGSCYLCVDSFKRLLYGFIWCAVCECVESSLVTRCGSEPALKQTTAELSECQSVLVKLTMVDNCCSFAAHSKANTFSCCRYVIPYAYCIYTHTYAFLPTTVLAVIF